jgi:hypothetical protein
MKDDERDDEKVDKASEESVEPETDPEDAAEPEAAASEDDGADKPADASPDPASSPERPLFAQGWPANPELDRLLDAFERGNYAYVRREAPKVAASASDPDVKGAALDLRKRIDPAPLAGILIFVAVGLLVVLAGHYLGKHNPGAPPTVAPASTNAPLQPAPTNR